MKSLILSTFESSGFFCELSAKVVAFWSSLGVHVQISMQLLSLLLVFLALSKLFACQAKTSCVQGCKCGCGEECNCKKEDE